MKKFSVFLLGGAVVIALFFVFSSNQKSVIDQEISGKYDEMQKKDKIVGGGVKENGLGGKFSAVVNENGRGNSVPSSFDISNLKIPVLMYHHIRDYNDPKDHVGTYLSVPSVKFAGELDYISKQGLTTTTFDKILGGGVPKNPVVLTFDDGYDNFYLNAYPELKKRHMSAVIFLIVNKLNTPGYMTSAEVKEMMNNGIEIGSHTLNHPDLRKLNDDDLRKEIVDSKSKLENMFGVAVQTFCYPFGFYNPKVSHVVANAGYKLAFTTKRGVADFSAPFDLSRHRVNLDTNITGYF